MFIPRESAYLEEIDHRIPLDRGLLWLSGLEHLEQEMYTYLAQGSLFMWNR